MPQATLTNPLSLETSPSRGKGSYREDPKQGVHYIEVILELFLEEKSLQSKMLERELMVVEVLFLSGDNDKEYVAKTGKNIKYMAGNGGK